MIYHISYDNPNLDKLVPRIPSTACEANENITIPRCCFAMSIEGCLSAIQQGDGIYHVYIPAISFSEMDDGYSFHIPSDEEVCDASITGEVWYLKEVPLKYIGSINATDTFRRTSYTISRFGNDEECHFHHYDWEWIERVGK